MHYLHVTNVSNISTTKILQNYKTNKPFSKAKHTAPIYIVKTFVNHTNCHTTIVDRQPTHNRDKHQKTSAKNPRDITHINI